MRKFSRHMPQLPPPGRREKIIGVVVLTLLAAYVVMLFINIPAALLVIPVGALISWEGEKKFRKKMVALKTERNEESICEFARSFDVRKVDPWIIRAVYEEVQRYLTRADLSPPALRADDDIINDLDIDAEDMEMDILSDIAQRAGRSLKDVNKNPYQGEIRTLRDLVLFLNEQEIRKEKEPT